MKSIIAILFASVALVACGKKEEAPVVEPVPAVAAPAPAPTTDTAPAPTPSAEPAKQEEAKK
jgi:PBP1b-binding outer membrane lipoprotein LpoB